MPLLVGTTIGPSSIHGTGLFALRFIPVGTRIWRFERPFDQVFSEYFMRLATPSVVNFIHSHGRYDPIRHLWLLAGDHARFINDSPFPNTEGSLIEAFASRNIAAGEEITCRTQGSVMAAEALPLAA